MTNRTDVAGWSKDPTGTHQLRYHDGAAFTQYVSDGGEVTLDGAAIDYPLAGDPLTSDEVASPAPSWPGAFQPGPSIPESVVQPFPTPTYGQGWAPPPPTATGTPSQWFASAAVASPVGKKRRVGLSLAIAAAALEAVAIVALSIALVAAHTTSSSPIGSTVGPSGVYSEDMGRVVYSSNFETNQGWSTGSLNANTTATLANGQYVVKGWTLVHHPIATPYAVPHTGLSVEASATNYPDNNVSIGTGCQSAYGISPALVYQMVLYPDGQWYIEEGRIPGSVETLLSGDTTSLGSAASLQLTCVITANASDKETTQLVGYVNGSKVGAIGDQINRIHLGGYVPVLVLGSFGPTVSAAFTNITVRSISPSA